MVKNNHCCKKVFNEDFSNNYIIIKTHDTISIMDIYNYFQQEVKLMNYTWKKKAKFDLYNDTID